VIGKHYISVCDIVTPNALHYRSLNIPTSTKHERDSTILTAAPPKNRNMDKIRQTLM